MTMNSLRQRIKRAAHGHKPIGDAHREAALFTRRALAGMAIIVLCLIGLGVRFWILQVRQHAELNARSDANRIVTRPLPPGRGLIYDRNGVLLAENIAAFRLEVTPEQAGDVQATVTRLGEVLPISDDDITRFNAQRKRKRSYEGIPLRLKLSEEEIARFSINRWAFPGVEVVPYLTRSYPLGAEFAHTVGYVGRIDENDLTALDAGEYAGTTHIGKTGIERSYEKRLHGHVGYEKIEVNADHRPLRVLPDRLAPVPGDNLYLSIDAHLQEVTEAAFEGRAGAAVAIDPRTGEVLAMVSVPSFDPNLFVNGISSVDYRGLLEAEHKPLLNRLLRGTYTPGSTMKPFVGLAGLELGLRKPEDTVLSTGEFFIPGQSRAYRDDVRGGFGRVDLVQAIARSVNTYFYSVSLDMGIDRFSDYLGRFGFGQPTGIDLLGEGSGVLILEELEHAKKRGAHIYAEVIGYGSNGDAYHITAPRPGGELAARCMKKAIDDAGISPDDIDYINAHGTSTGLNDKNETKAIKDVLGKHAYDVVINSTKSMTGHLLGAAGAIEAIVCVLSIEHNKVHQTLNLKTPDPECDLDYVPEGPRDVKVDVTMSNAFGFGGHNAVVIMRRYEE